MMKFKILKGERIIHVNYIRLPVIKIQILVQRSRMWCIVVHWGSGNYLRNRLTGYQCKQTENILSY